MNEWCLMLNLFVSKIIMDICPIEIKWLLRGLYTHIAQAKIPITVPLLLKLLQDMMFFINIIIMVEYLFINNNNIAIAIFPEYYTITHYK